jgi:hypothetical protein
VFTVSMRPGTLIFDRCAKPCAKRAVLFFRGAIREEFVDPGSGFNPGFLG